MKSPKYLWGYEVMFNASTEFQAEMMRAEFERAMYSFRSFTLGKAMKNNRISVRELQPDEVVVIKKQNKNII